MWATETCYPMLFYCLMADVSDNISTTALSVTVEPRRKGTTLPHDAGMVGHGSRRDDAYFIAIKYMIVIKVRLKI